MGFFAKARQRVRDRKEAEKRFVGSLARARETVAARTPSYTPSREELAETARIQAVEDRFGHDMAWLDPAFTQEAQTIDTKGEVGRDAQMRALEQLFGVAEGGGYSAEERAKRLQSRQEAEGWLRGQREADLQNLAERGMSGSGAELTSLGMANQAAANRMALGDAEAAASGEKRALDAMMAAGDIGGSLTTANDRISQLNQAAINDVRGANAKFRQGAWRDTLDKRQEWEIETNRRADAAAIKNYGTDVAENEEGYRQAESLGKGDAEAYDRAATAYRNAKLGQAGLQGDAYVSNAADDAEFIEEGAAAVGKMVDQWGQGASGSMPTGGGGGGGMPANGEIFDEEEVFGK